MGAAGRFSPEVQEKLFSLAEPFHFATGPGEVCNWSAAVEPRVSTASVRAVQDTAALWPKGGVVMDRCREHSGLGFEP